MAKRKMGNNPFSNKLVIDTISKYLSFQELKVCRRLNHLWKKTTNNLFLKLCPSLQLFSFLPKGDDPDSNQIRTISQFMEIYSDRENPHPHAQILRQYRNFSVHLLAEEYIPIFFNFMTVVGPQMISLGLIVCEVLRNSQDLVDIVSSKYTPKLEILVIYSLREIKNFQQDDPETVRIEGKENKHLHRLSLTNIDVLSRYPKLKTLSVGMISIDVLEEIAISLVSMRKANETKLKLTKLKISQVYCTRRVHTDDEIKVRWQRIRDLLNTANLPLEKISLDYTTKEISSELLQTYGENLKSLTLKGSIPQPFPLMEALEEIVVIECGMLTFLTEVPNLKSLCFYPHFSSQIRFPESTPNPLLSLTKLHTGFWKEWNVIELEQLLLWMPNVQYLSMLLDNTSFAWICQNLPNLKELTVWGNKLDDSGVVGEFDGALPVEGGRPNITNLKALETFKMDVIATSGEGLTEKSIFFGFSRMPKLSNLRINVKSKLSGTTMRALNRGIKNVLVRFTTNVEEDFDKDESDSD